MGKPPTTTSASVTYYCSVSTSLLFFFLKRRLELTAGLKAAPVTRENAQAFTIKLNPKASAIYSKLLVDGNPAALAGAVLATCVAAKAKNKNRKVPTNSPIPNTRLVRIECDMLAKGAILLDCLPTAVDVLELECEWEWERVYCCLLLVGVSGDDGGIGLTETETRWWLGPSFPSSARPAFSVEGEGKGDGVVVVVGLDARRPVDDGTSEDGRNGDCCEGASELGEARGVLLFISTTEIVLEEETGSAWAPIVSAAAAFYPFLCSSSLDACSSECRWSW